MGERAVNYNSLRHYPEGPLACVRDWLAFAFIVHLRWPSWRGGLWERIGVAVLPYAGGWAYAQEHAEWLAEKAQR